MSTFPEKIFVSHYGLKNLIPLSDAVPSLIVILIVLFFLIILSARAKTPLPVINGEHFTFDTTKTLRGLAILFLILGHMSNQVLDGFKPLYWAGDWAVIIFLFVSAIGLAKKYSLTDVRKGFVNNRLQRLLLPVWITLTPFYLSDYFLLNRTHAPLDIILHFSLIISPDPPNGPDWFITYILYLYMLFYISTILVKNKVSRCAVIYIFSYIAIFVVMPRISADWYFRRWIEYSNVFPVALLIGYYHKRVMIYTESLYHFSKWLYFILLILFLLLYNNDTGIQIIATSVRSYTLSEICKTLGQLYLLVPLIMCSHLLDRMQIRSTFLTFMGEYSLEIYLLHFPFMIFYDFCLFRRPLAIWFFCYLSFIIFLSFILRKSSTYLTQVVFKPSGLSAAPAIQRG